MAGTNAGGYSGDIRTAESYGSDQYSQVKVTSTQLTGSQWVGPAVRAQAGGRTSISASTSGTAAARADAVRAGQRHLVQLGAPTR